MMDQAQFLSLFQEMLTNTLILSAPVLGTALVVGVLISMLQTVTQIQEATLTFVPKVLACIAVLMLIAPWMMDQLMTTTVQHFALLQELAKPEKPGLPSTTSAASSPAPQEKEAAPAKALAR
jgi:flagellar biosynthesis protein FliQ